MDALENPMKGNGLRSRFTPPANAIENSPCHRPWQAWWIATKEDEQAVSIDTLGPWRSRA